MIYIASLLILLLVASANADTNCRFANLFTTQDVFSNTTVRDVFLRKYASWEARFMKGIGIDRATGLTYDGQRLDVASGLPFGLPHTFSAASKESLHLAILAKVVEGKHDLARALYSKEEAFALLAKKATSYETFNSRFPGMGGFLPWYSISNGEVKPAWDWQNRVPSLDNAEWFWTVFAVWAALGKHPSQWLLRLRYEVVWKRMVENVLPLFYEGNGTIRAVTKMTNQSLPVNRNKYENESPGYNLDDPYEGELLTNMVYLFTNLSAAEKQKLWVNKRAKLQLAVLNVTEGITTKRIAVQRGFWFSAHEQWKYLMMPYFGSETNRRVFLNGERARTWYAVTQGSPGLWASVNGPIRKNSDEFPYFSDCGIEAVSFQKVRHNDVITPYGAFPVILASTPTGVAWLHHVLTFAQGQNCWGSTEAFNITGNQVAPLTTWDSKVTTLVAVMGGVVDLVSDAMQKLGVLHSFVDIIESEWQRVFHLPLLGEELPLRLPNAFIPHFLEDFTSCSSNGPACPS